MYKQLTQENRYQIHAFIQAGSSQAEIATEIGVSKATISRELKRNSGGRGYRPKQANQFAEERKHIARKSTILTPLLVSKIEERLVLKWSPEQISGRLLKEEGIEVSHETIYKHVERDKKNGGHLYTHLRHQKKRRKRYGSKCRKGKIKDRVPIEKRPKAANKKSRIGDWEGDTVIGQNHKGVLVTLVDRKSKKTLIGKSKDKTAKSVTQVVSELLKDQRCHTITFDNGLEFAGHKEIVKVLGCKVFFANPYSSFERGLNENTNGLIRQYFPKKSSFENISQKDLEHVMNALDNRPRKTIDYQTPNEVYLRGVALRT